MTWSLETHLHELIQWQPPDPSSQISFHWLLSSIHFIRRGGPQIGCDWMLSFWQNATFLTHWKNAWKLSTCARCYIRYRFNSSNSRTLINGMTNFSLHSAAEYNWTNVLYCRPWCTLLEIEHSWNTFVSSNLSAIVELVIIPYIRFL